MEFAQTLPSGIENIVEKTPDGTWRITGTRVSLDSIVYAFRRGSTPEEICQDFSTLSLDQAYTAIAYYLRHQGAIDTYLAEQDEYDQTARQELAQRHSAFYQGLRKRLLDYQSRSKPAKPAEAV
jgi:uncharacterized protein (DUF433 family)